MNSFHIDRLRRALLPLIAPLVLGLEATSLAWGQPAEAYPSRTVTLVLPLAPGGATDTLARAVAQGVSARLGQPVVLDHRPGAGGTIASAAVARAAADGHTLLFANFATHATAPALFKSLSYDPVKDFRGVSLVATSPHLLLVNPASGITSVRQLIDTSRQPGRKLNYGSSGSGSPLHLAAEYFSAETGSTIVHVPFKSSGPALNELMAGRLDAMFDNLSSSLPLVQAGKLRAVAVTSDARSSLSPTTPTVQEQGLRGFNTYGWWGVLAPAGTPPAVVQKLTVAIQETLKSPAVRQGLEAQGFDVIGSSPSEFEAHIGREIAKWSRVIGSAGISVE